MFFPNLHKKISALERSDLSSQKRDLELEQRELDLEKKILALQKEVFDTKTASFAAENKAKEHDEWEKEKANYNTYQLGNSVVYTRTAPGTFREFFCPNCFIGKRVVHLQPSLVSKYLLVCPSCKSEYKR